MSNEQDMLIFKLNKDLSRAQLALGKIYNMIDNIYFWDEGYAMDPLEREDVEEIAKILQEYFDGDTTKPTKKE